MSRRKDTGHDRPSGTAGKEQVSGLKKLMLLGGIPVRPSTKKERASKKQLAELKQQTELLKRLSKGK